MTFDAMEVRGTRDTAASDAASSPPFCRGCCCSLFSLTVVAFASLFLVTLGFRHLSFFVVPLKPLKRDGVKKKKRTTDGLLTEETMPQTKREGGRKAQNRGNDYLLLYLFFFLSPLSVSFCASF